MKKPLTLLASETMVRLIDGDTEVARHERGYDKGGRVDDETHLEGLAKQRRRAAELGARDVLRATLKHPAVFIDGLAAKGAVLGAKTSRQLRLLREYGPKEVDGALAEAMARGAFSGLRGAPTGHASPPTKAHARHRRRGAGVGAPHPRHAARARRLRLAARQRRGRIMSAPRSTRLAALGLHWAASSLDDVIALAAKRRWGPVELLGHIAEQEAMERARRSMERRRARAKLGRFGAMGDFDWAWPTRIAKPAVESALKLDFLKEQRNLVIVAPQGLGKTMIAQNIAHQAVVEGHTTLFTTASQLLLDLGAQDSPRALDRRLKHYARASLLVVDEVGYLSYDARNADLLFQIVSRRYEEKSLVLPTNLPFGDWATIFPNAVCATALIDRIVHHADIIAIEGKSCRRRAAEESKKAKAKK